MSIRLATKEDAQAIHNLHTESVTKLCNQYSNEVITGWLTNRKPEGYFDGIDQQEIYVYVDKNEILGFNHTLPGEIRAIFVAPKSARQGIGTALLTQAISRAQNNEEDVIKLEATLNAVPFYEKFGFKQIKESIIYRNNVEIPIIIMEKSSVIMRNT